VKKYQQFIHSFLFIVRTWQRVKTIKQHISKYAIKKLGEKNTQHKNWQ